MVKRQLDFLKVSLMYGILVLIGLTFLTFHIPSIDAEEADENSYKNSHLLVSAQWVKENLVDSTKSDAILVDARGEVAYNAGHIPRAINLDTGDLNETVDNVPVILKSAEVVASALAEHGISKSKQLIIYSDGKSWGADGRLFWILEYLGHKKVHILNGGITGWIAHGYPTTAEISQPIPEFSYAPFPYYRKRKGAEKDEIFKNLNNPDFIIIDTRTTEEYEGAILYGEARGGRIPGAINLPFDEVLKKDTKVFKTAEEIKAIFKEKGIPINFLSAKKKTFVTYCTAGIRSGHTYFLLRLMGYAGPKNYDGSFYEWALDQSLPIQ
ncbi:MAG: sulfurtransferase [Thermodesulfobacteriota bacterium]|nr:sulfurtransferase [Thermodesulfobacteriota bacterium]